MAKFCKNCGTDLNGSDVCHNCGTSHGTSKKTNNSDTTNKTINNTNSTNNTNNTNNAYNNYNNGYNSYQPSPTNGMAIAGFILSLLGCFSFLGLVFSIIGLVQAPKYNDNGKGLAIAGIVISGIRVFIYIIWGFFALGNGIHEYFFHF